MPEIKTLRVDQASRLTPRGDITPIYRVVWSYGEHGPFTTDFDSANFIPENVKKEQDRIVETLKALGA